jgi:hypothetical protein
MVAGQGVREDHPDPVRAIHLTKWLVKASYTDENEESTQRTRGFLVLQVGESVEVIGK